MKPEKKRIHVDLDAMSEILQTPVIGITARANKGLDEIFVCLTKLMNQSEECRHLTVTYDEAIEHAITSLMTEVGKYVGRKQSSLDLCQAAGCRRESAEINGTGIRCLS